MTWNRGRSRALRTPSRAPGLLLGLGLGGFVDGIVLHQVFQWHHMVTSVDRWPATTLAGLEANTVADGLFHVGMWILVFAGVVTTFAGWRRGRLGPPWSFHLGLLLAGWGVFNLVEGVVDHHILEVHHVRDDLGAPVEWDIGFLVSGALLLVGGWLWHRKGVRTLSEEVEERTVRT